VARADAPIGYGIVQPGPYVRDGIPVLAIRDLTSPSAKTAHRSAPGIEAAYRRSRVVGGDILVSVKGTIGRIGIVPEHFKGNISRDIARVRLRDEHAPRFWLQLLQSTNSQRTMELAAVGTTRQELSIGTLKTLRFRFPAKSAQEQIAAALYHSDDLIAALEAFITKKWAVRQGMMQQLLTGKMRLPGFSRPWLRTTVGDIATINKGQQLGRASMDSQQSVPVWNGGIEPSGFTGLPNIIRPVVTVSEGGNSCGWVGRPRGAFWLGGHCYALEPKGPSHSTAYLYYALKANEHGIMSLRVGSGLPNIQKRSLRGFALCVPSDSHEAAAIAGVLDDMSADIDLLESRLDKARAIKQGMMQELLSGRTRLPAEAVL